MANTDSYRLARTAVPRRYNLAMRPHLDTATFEGTVSVDLELAQATDSLMLNAAELEISSAELTSPSGEVLTAAAFLHTDQERLELRFDASVRAGAGYRLSLAFSGVLNDHLRGFYRSTFKSPDGAEVTIATTQFEATDARRAFPCWDEPDFKATFQVTLDVPAGCVGLSNGPVVSEEAIGGGWTRVRFAETMPMSTYLVAFIVGPFELTSPVDVSGVPIRVATVPSKQALTPFALQAAAHALSFLSGYFAIPYPEAKLDHVAIPDFAFGAMENLGLVTYRETALLVDSDRAAQTEMARVASVIAHETAHMWFGDLVTMKWWNGIWLNEAFATFMELTTTDAFKPAWQVWAAFAAGKAAAMAVDGLESTRPVEYPVGRPEEAEGMFDLLTYQKGGSVLKMLERYLGAETFRLGISAYLSSHAYSNTETSDLWEALEDVSGEPVRAIMDSWIFQGGHPLVEAALSGDGTSVALSQRRFTYRPAPAGAGTATWKVPVNLRVSAGGTVRDERLLLEADGSTLSFDTPVDWVIVNAGGWGFYRCSYSRELRRRLVSAGLAEVAEPMERFNYLNDTWAEVVVGTADVEEWAAGAVALGPDSDPDVWTSLGSGLHMLVLAGDDEDRDAVASFAASLASPVWNSVGWTPAPGEPERTATARARVLSVLAQVAKDPAVVAECVARLREHLVSPAGSGRLAADLVGVCARVAVGSGGEDEWNLVMDAYTRAVSPQEEQRYLFALAEATSESLRERTLQMTLGSQVRSQDAPLAIATLMGQPGAASQAWAWVESNWDELASRMPHSLLVRILEATSSFVDPSVAARVKAFCSSKDLTVSPVRLAQILERLDVNVTLAQRLRGTIAAGLAGLGAHDG
jgi:puromycin-sensitive aminopeptidase